MRVQHIAVICAGLLLAGVATGQTPTNQQTYCAGAQGASTACAQGCSGTRINNDVTPNTGTFNEGGGNNGDGNDGFQNIGNFNIGFSNVGNCIIDSGRQGGGSCDVNNDAGRIVLRFCAVYPTDNKCNPGGYPAEFTQALQDALPAVVASCNGGPAVSSPPPAPLSPPPPATPPTAASPPADSPVPAAAPGAEPVDPLVPADLVKPPSAGFTLPNIDPTQFDLSTLLQLLEEHIQQEGGALGALGRKLKL